MTKSEKKGETKNQHYVPQFYQRYFSKDNKNIGVYVVSNDINISSAPIKSQSSEDYFYSENMKIEHALGKMEELSKSVIDRIIASPKEQLTKEDQYTLYVFTMIQVGRTRAQASLMQESVNAILRTVARKHFEVLRKNDEENDLEYVSEEILDKVQFDLKEPGVFALGTQAQLINTCIDLNYKILINNTQIPFITSDNPAVLYDQFMERVGNQTYALSSRGVQIYLPLTPMLGVMYYDSKCYKLGHRRKAYVEITQNCDICELNKLAASNAENTIYYKPGSITDYELKQVATQNKKNKPSSHIETLPELESSEGGTIVGSRNKVMFCKLKLSFIKELPHYKAIQPKCFNSAQHQYREIAYVKDDLVRMTANE